MEVKKIVLAYAQRRKRLWQNVQGLTAAKIHGSIYNQKGERFW